MTPRSELNMALMLVTLLSLGLALGAVGLFARMGPAIERILDENAASIISAEHMMRVLSSENTPKEVILAELRADLARLTANLTEEAEGPLLEAVAADIDAYAENPLTPRDPILDHLSQLSDVNHAAMTHAGKAARRLGMAGAWGAVWVGLLSIGLSLVVLSRIRRRIVEPLEELECVLRQAGGANPSRRCHVNDVPLQVQNVMRGVNALLDLQLKHKPRPSSNETRYRNVIRGLLERLNRPAAVCDERGALVAANLAMLDALAGDRGDVLRAALSELDPDANQLERTPLPEQSGQLCIVSAGPQRP